MEGTSFPNFRGKDAHASIISPEESMARFRSNPELEVPPGVVIAYQPQLVDYLKRRGAKEVFGYPAPFRSLLLIDRPGHATVAVAAGFGLGSPAAVVTLENLTALGARQFINMGAAGSLQDDLDFGDVVLCTGAIRDEGTSHHYLSPSKFALPDPVLSARLADELRDRGMPFREGMSWTIDAFYRETLEEAHSYRDEGIVTVEMEAAALFAVAHYRSVAMASAFVVSDHLLTESTWVYAFGTPTLAERSIDLLEAALAVLGS